MKFEWDENKNKLNIKKHGISFADACYVFADTFALSIPDNEHSDSEERWLLLGKSVMSSKILLVVHTIKIGDIIRIISARKATKQEEQAYFARSSK
jgi:uncharacterized DUF497 family protein